MISSSQIKAARAMLGWSGRTWPRRVTYGPKTVRRYEMQDRYSEWKHSCTIEIASALEQAGIEFTGDPLINPGVTLRLSNGLSPIEGFFPFAFVGAGARAALPLLESLTFVQWFSHVANSPSLFQLETRPPCASKFVNGSPRLAESVNDFCPPKSEACRRIFAATQVPPDHIGDQFSVWSSAHNRSNQLFGK